MGVKEMTHQGTIARLARQLVRIAISRSEAGPFEPGEAIFEDTDEITVYLTGADANDLLLHLYGSDWSEACKVIARLEASSPAPEAL